MAPENETVRGGMLNPDAFGVLDPGPETRPAGGHGRERDYNHEPDYGDVDGDAFGQLFGDDAVYREAGVAADGGYQDRALLKEVEHTPPDWTNMENPSL